MKVSGGEAVVRSLLECGVKTIYGLPGSHVLDIYNSLRDEIRIRNILAMHEVNAAFMADAHGRLTGRPGVCIVTGGPGATNAVTGIAQAFTEASPVIQITGHSSSRKKIQPYHSVDDWDFLLKIYTPLTKWSIRIDRVKDVPLILGKAFDIASSGRPGPVHVEIPSDVLANSGEIGASRVTSKDEPLDTPYSVKRVVEILESASSPMIAVGKGVLREFCSDEVIGLATRLGAPILTLPSSIGAIPYQCPLYLGYDLGTRWLVHPVIKSLVEKADAILTLGFDVGERLAYFRGKNCKIIHVHQDASAIGDRDTNRPKSTLHLEASIRDFVILLKNQTKQKRCVGTVERSIADIKKKIREDIIKSIKWGAKPIHPGEISMELGRILADDAIVTLDVGDSSEWMKICSRARKSNTILAPGRYGSMGFSLPAAIAAGINFPERQVVAVTGDGGFLMSCMDFPTLVKYRLRVLIIVESNRRYGMIWNIQRTKYKGRTFSTEIEIPNFAEYAQSFGVTGIQVRDPKELRKALDEATGVKGPVLVDVNTAYRFPSYMPTRLRRFLRRIKHLGMSSDD